MKPERVGAPSAFKSFLSVDWALSVAHGLDWFGKPTKQGPILYVAAEGANGMMRRFEGWAMHRGVTLCDDVYLSQQPLMFPQSRDQVVEAARQLEIEPAMIVLDTLNRTMEGEENSSTDFAAFIQSVDQIRAQFPGVTILIVHHLGKDAARGARGSSAIHGAMDQEFSLVRLEGEGMRAALECAKMKDAPETEGMVLEAKQVPLSSIDATTLVLLPGADKTAILDLEHEQMARAIAAGMASDGKSFTHWRKHLYPTLSSGRCAAVKSAGAKIKVFEIKECSKQDKIALFSASGAESQAGPHSQLFD